VRSFLLFSSFFGAKVQAKSRTGVTNFNKPFSRSSATADRPAQLGEARRDQGFEAPSISAEASSAANDATKHAVRRYLDLPTND
jgi:hypothetical protein